MANKLRFQKQIIYRLKRDMGTPVDYYQPISNVQNVKTGVVVRSFTVTPVKRALVFETKELRKFEYDLSFIAANKNFTMGGYFDQAERFILLDVEDLPKDFSPSSNDHVVSRGRRYQVILVNELEDNRLIAVKVKELKGMERSQIHVVTIESVAYIKDTASGNS